MALKTFEDTRVVAEFWSLKESLCECGIKPSSVWSSTYNFRTVFFLSVYYWKMLSISSNVMIQQGRLDLLWLRNKVFWRSRYAADLFGPRYCFTTLWLLNCCWLTLTFQWLGITARQRAHILIGALPIRSKSQESKMNGTTEVAALQNLPQSTSPSFCKNLFASLQSNSSLCKTST